MTDVGHSCLLHWRGWLLPAALAIFMHIALLWLVLEGNQGPSFPAVQSLNITLVKLVQAKQKSSAPVPAERAPKPESKPVTVPAEKPLKPVMKKVRKAAAKKETASVAPPRQVPVPDRAPAESPAEDAPARQAAIPDSSPDYHATYLHNPVPRYPNAARRRGVQGRVLLHVEVLAAGHCGRIEVQQSSGHTLLDEAAVDAVKQWRFVPAHYAGIAVTRWMQVPIRFQLVSGRRN